MAFYFITKRVPAGSKTRSRAARWRARGGRLEEVLAHGPQAGDKLLLTLHLGGQPLERGGRDLEGVAGHDGLHLGARGRRALAVIQLDERADGVGAAVGEVDLAVDAARADERWVEQLRVVGGHDHDAVLGLERAVQGVEQAGQRELVRLGGIRRLGDGAHRVVAALLVGAAHAARAHLREECAEKVHGSATLPLVVIGAKVDKVVVVVVIVVVVVVVKLVLVVVLVVLVVLVLVVLVVAVLVLVVLGILAQPEQQRHQHAETFAGHPEQLWHPHPGAFAEHPCPRAQGPRPVRHQGQ
mmetsp:Transcript_13027/g.36700  ORF Transcript_13027/g.36700 Transcript_13027/m.36700 type:complete len:298 (+) Transcript_13027:150-1043(+)